jgi:hypothetical protein
MPTPRRRSARLRGSAATPGKVSNSNHSLSTNHSKRSLNLLLMSSSLSQRANAFSNGLSSLVERDETPTQGPQPTLDSIISSPIVPQTPATVGRIKPAFEEMHPGQTHSAASPSFDFRSAHTPATAGRIKPPFEEMHPSKAQSISSPSFDFRFARPTPNLGPEAQKMMEELREEALRIKVKLAAEREEEKSKRPSEESFAAEGRKFATPKGKVGRFSDIHMAEFKKMDSIAGHASAFRAQPGRSANAPPSLKRTQSKAKLDDREDVPQGPALKRTQSKAKLDDRDDVARVTKPANQSERLENIAPAKRARVDIGQDVSQPATPTLSRSRSILDSLTTPTQASLARSASVKPATKIPTLSHSPSKQSLTAPRGLTKSATMTNIGGMSKSESIQNFARTPSKLDRMKSMFHRHTQTSEKPSEMPASYLPILKSPGKANLDKQLPSIPANPATPELDRSRSIKHVQFTPTTLRKNAESIQNSPSVAKSGIPRSKSTMTLGAVSYPLLSSMVDDGGVASKDISYPVLTPSRVPRRALEEIAPAAPTEAGPGTFTFRSDQTIKFANPPPAFGSSPGQVSVRQVRPSIFPTGSSMPGSFPDSDKENIGGLPAIPHGLYNKKRRRASSDEEEEERAAEGSPIKKRKGLDVEFENLVAPKLEAEKMATKSKIPSPAKRGKLSLSRLNMLARPKMRK